MRIKIYGFFLFVIGITLRSLRRDNPFICAMFFLSLLGLLTSGLLYYLETGTDGSKLYLTAAIVAFPGFILRLMRLIDKYVDVFNEHFFYSYFIVRYFLLLSTFPIILGAAARINKEELRPLIVALRIAQALLTIVSVLMGNVSMFATAYYLFILASVVHGIVLISFRGLTSHGRRTVVHHGARRSGGVFFRRSEEARLLFIRPRTHGRGYNKALNVLREARNKDSRGRLEEKI